MRYGLIYLLLIISSPPVFSETQNQEKIPPCDPNFYLSEKGLVPDEQTAKALAEVILTPIYGRDSIARQKPFAVMLDQDRWIVSGYLPPHMLGGTFLIVIAKQDGRVIRISHGK